MPFGTARITLLNLSMATLIGRCSVINQHEELEALYRFRYRIYIEELGKDLPAADHGAKRLPDPDDDTGVHFIVGRRTTRPVACARLHVGHRMPLSCLEQMGVSEAVRADGYRGGFVSKLMVERSLRGQGAAMVLMVAMAVHGADWGDYGLFHCSSKLVRMYERYGFQRTGAPFETEYTGTQVPMIGVYGDYEHYRDTGSPLAPYFKAYRLPTSRIQELKDLFHLPFREPEAVDGAPDDPAKTLDDVTEPIVVRGPACGTKASTWNLGMRGWVR